MSSILIILTWGDDEEGRGGLGVLADLLAASLSFIFFSSFFWRFLTWAIFEFGVTLCSKPGGNSGPEQFEEPREPEVDGAFFGGL